MSGRVFGEIPGFPEGSTFTNRHELHLAGVHKPNQAGISGSGSEGADSIVVNGGYEDDEDGGDVIIYTGAGGNFASEQVGHQELTRGNLALKVSCDRRLPVRVIRGAKAGRHGPRKGYRYDGLYYVERYWEEKGKSGYMIWRFRMNKA